MKTWSIDVADLFFRILLNRFAARKIRWTKSKKPEVQGGMANATWPFATLTVNKNELQLKASIIGNLVFKPSDIIAIGHLHLYSPFRAGNKDHLMLAAIIPMLFFGRWVIRMLW